MSPAPIDARVQGLCKSFIQYQRDYEDAQARAERVGREVDTAFCRLATARTDLQAAVGPGELRVCLAADVRDCVFLLHVTGTDIAAEVVPLVSWKAAP